VAVVCMNTALVVGAGPVLAAASSTASTPSFGLGSAQPTDTTTTVLTTPATIDNTTTTANAGSGVSGGDAIVIGVVVLGLLLGIAVFVMRDARSHTAGDPDPSDNPFADKRKGSKAPPKSRKLKPAERKRRKRSRAPRKRW
jgi:threonine dehydrogenase-like Zn-dependent dehydrogenase